MVADFYAMLGADPGADRASLEAALARCQPAWSSGTRNPKTKHTYQSYLDRIPEIKRTILGGPHARAAYDAELAATRRAERDAKLDELQRLVKLRAAKGGLTVGDRTLLREKAGNLGLSPDDLDRLIEPIPPRPDSPAEVDAFEPAPDVLDAVTRKQIRVALEHLRKRDLYDALGLRPDAPTAEVAAKADAERRRWMQKTQVTAEKTAWLEVVSHAQSHLGSAESRARYDRTLGADAEARFAESIDWAIKGLARLDYSTRAALISEAGREGIRPDRAEVLISRGCRRFNVAGEGAAPLILGASIEPPRYLRCRSCSGVTDFAEVSTPPARPECRHCRNSLQWTCPGCKRVRWVDESQCVCGFPIEHVEPLQRHFEAAQQAHRDRDYPSAREHLERVRQYAPTHPGAKKGLDTIRRHLQEAEAAKLACELARSQRRLIEAQTAAQAWARLVPPDSPEVAAVADDLARRIQTARSLASQGRAAERDDPKAAKVESLDPMGGSERFLMTTTERVTDASGTATFSRIALVSAASGSATPISLSRAERGGPLVEALVSSDRPVGFLERIDERTKRIRAFGLDGRLGPELNVERASGLGFDRQGKGRQLSRRPDPATGKTRLMARGFDFATGKLGEWQPFKALPEPEEGRLSIQDTSFFVAKGVKAPSLLLALKGGKTEESGVLSTDGKTGLLSPKGDAVAFLDGGMAIVRTLARIDRKAYDDALRAQEIADAVQKAKQIGVGLLIYAADYDDNLPANDGDVNAKLAPYLKNNALLAGFVYTFRGGSMADIRSPADTEMGYVEGPGGRVVIYTDGHTKWVPSLP